MATKPGASSAGSAADPLLAAALAGADLAPFGPGDATARRLANNAGASRLTSLSLRGCGVGPAGAKALAGSTFLRKLHKLDLEENAIGDAGAKALAGSTRLKGLRVLLLGHDTFGARGSPASNSIGPKGALAVATSKSFARLERLSLPIAKVDAALARALVRSKLARFLALFPGANESSAQSPDGKSKAVLALTDEVWGDGPRAGLVKLTGGLVLADVGPSFIWSSDSRTLAATQWERGADGGFTGKSRVVVLDPEAHTVARLPKPPQGALVLFAFRGGVLEAFDAYAKTRKDLSIDTRKARPGAPMAVLASLPP